MQKFTFDRRQTGFFTDQQNKLINGQEELLPFINHVFSKQNFSKHIEEKKNSYSQKNRKILHDHLINTYANLSLPEQLKKNIEALESNRTFTVTTGHQLNIFAGPIYLIYKILDVIKMCEELNQEFEEFHFVPCYWMATEDHDFEEIASTTIFGENLYWQSNQKGAVGNFSIDGLQVLKEKVSQLFKNASSDSIHSILDAYQGENLAEAHFNLFHELFKDYGLIIIDGNKKQLKELFIPHFQKEINEQFSYKSVKSTNQLIEKNGLKTQVNPREINLFYLGEQSRERILHLEDDFFIEGVGRRSRKELIDEINEFPERFSPNVALRPLYQECILPNLCYVGGVGELSYWIQLKQIFDTVGVTYPMIKPRSSVLWIDSSNANRMHKADVVIEDLFSDITNVKKQYLLAKSAAEIDFNISDKAFDEVIWQLEDKAKYMDANTEKMIAAESVKLAKQYLYIKEKLLKSVKQKHEKDLKAIDTVFDKLFPNGGLQERHLSIFTMCPEGNLKERIAQLYQYIEPFSSEFMVIRE